MRWAAFVPVATLLTSGPANAERIADPSLGLTIEIPADWCELPTTEVNKDISGFEKNNPQWAGAVRKYGFVPIHLFGRSPSPNSLFSASVNLSMRPATPVNGQSDQEALLAFLNAQQVPNAKVVTAPEIVTLARAPTGDTVLSSSLNVGATPVPITMEVWAIRRGGNYLVLGASYHTDPAAGDRAEVLQIVNSLKFTDSAAAGK